MTTLISVAKDGTAFDVLAQRYRVAFDKTQGGREQWIEGKLELAVVVAEARELMPDHRDYGRWTTRYQLEHMHPAELAALAGIGNLERRKPGVGRQLLEKNFGLAIRTIWENKREKPKTDPSENRRGQLSRNSGSSKRKRAAARLPDVMRDDNPPPLKPERKGVVLKALTPKEVDPDFKGTPLEFTTKYGHVLLHTKEQIEYNKRQEALMAWIGTIADHERTGRAMLAALPSVDPATLKEWMAKPGKADKINAWSKSVQVACEALYNMISNV